MVNLRRYDDDIYLSAFIMLFDTLGDEMQRVIANDILNEIPKAIKRDYNKFIKMVQENNSSNQNRWYDKNPNVHLAIESLRDLPEAERDNIVKEFSDKILSSHYIKIEGLS